MTAMPAVTGDLHEGSLASADGLQLHYQERVIPGARAQILVVHGLAEHCGRYEAFGQFFAGHGIGVSIMDLRGHGESEGRRVWVPSFESFLADLDLFLEHVQRHGKPVVLVGHSLGGLIALRFAENRQPPLAGLVLSGAALKSGITPPRPVVWLLRQLNRVSSATPLPGLVKPSQVSRDPEVVRRYEADPRVPKHLTTGLGVAAMEAAPLALRDTHRVDSPTLVLHGGDDSIADPAGSRELHAGLGVQDKQLNVYPGLFHEIFNEPEREEVLTDVLRWIEERART
jgi:alpha-beta hydrolase superfamily lysophospholipase